MRILARGFKIQFVLTVFVLAGCRSGRLAEEEVQADAGDFSKPERVTIRGYDGDAMEPFVSRDGKYLLFNNLNDPKVNTDLHWAERVDDVTFQYRGKMGGVNTDALEGVASLDRAGRFYFVSTRSYSQTASTLYRGRFKDGNVADIELVRGVSIRKPGIVNFDAEISADGETLYFVESEFGIMGQPKTARILFAKRNGGVFARSAESAKVMEKINTEELNYAPATSASELEIFFTRLTRNGPQIFWATRASRSTAFEAPKRIGAITGFVEAPTLSPDEKSLYYHKKEAGKFVIYRVMRP